MAGEVHVLAGDLLPVVARIALGLGPEARGETREGPLDDEDALLSRAELVAILIDDRGLDPGERHPAGAWLDRERRDAVRVADHGTAGLGLPVVIDDRHAILERFLLEPLPRRRVEHLARAEEALERTEIVLASRLGAVPHEKARRGRRREDARHLVPVDDRVEGPGVRMVERALVRD